MNSSIFGITHDDTSDGRLTRSPRHIAWLSDWPSNEIINSNALLIIVKIDQQVQIIDVALDDAGAKRDRCPLDQLYGDNLYRNVAIDELQDLRGRRNTVQRPSE